MIDYSVMLANTNGSAFPATEAVNASGPTATDGTEFVKSFIDDQWGFRQALMSEAGLIPNGVQESVSNSQALQAIKKIGFEIVNNPGDLQTFAWKTKKYYMYGTYSNGPSTLTGSFIADVTVYDTDNLHIKISPFTSEGKYYTIVKLITVWGSWTETNLSAIIVSNVRQTVQTGPVDANGRASYVAAGSGLQAVTTGVSPSVPLILSFGDGFNNGDKNFIKKVESNLTWNGLVANSTNYLYIDYDQTTDTITTGSVATLYPKYLDTAPSTPATNQYWYPRDHRSRGEYWNGSAWSPVIRLFCGEVVTDASSVANAISYAYQGRANLVQLAVATNANINLNHNIGVENYNLTASGVYNNITGAGGAGGVTNGTGGYRIGDGMQDASSQYLTSRLIITNSKTVNLRTGSPFIYYGASANTSFSGADAYITARRAF